jgi:hypothetical protein
MAAGITMGLSIGLGGLGAPILGALADAYGLPIMMLVEGRDSPAKERHTRNGASFQKPDASAVIKQPAAPSASATISGVRVTIPRKALDGS